MKNLPVPAVAHLARCTTTLALCWKVIRKDTTVLGFTSTDRDLTWGGVTYKAKTGVANKTVLASSTSVSVDTHDVELLLDSEDIITQDLAAGLYDYAQLWFYLVDHTDPESWNIILARGTLGQVIIKDNVASVEFRSLKQALQQDIGRLFTRRCDADFGDTRCGVDLGPLTVTGTVTSVTNRKIFVGSAVPARKGGKITWTSGQNTGLAGEIKAIVGYELRLMLPAIYNITPGDGYSVYAGCDKLFSTCRDIYNNVINFRGFPHIPGYDAVLRYPDSPV